MTEEHACQKERTEACKKQAEGADRLGNERGVIAVFCDLATLLFEAVALALELCLLGVDLRLKLGEAAVLVRLHLDELNSRAVTSARQDEGEEEDRVSEHVDAFR